MIITFSYCLDAAGNLIRLQLDQYPHALIPASVELVTDALELAHPKPWTFKLADAVKEVKFVPRIHVVGTHAEQIHISGEIPLSPYVFVAPCADYASDDQVMQLIALYDELTTDHIGRKDIIEALASVGIKQIPPINRFVPELHEADQAGAVSGYAAPGWISHTKVYRKAIFAS